MSEQPEQASEKPIDRSKLLNALIEYFNEEDLRDLCFDLEVRYDHLPGRATKDKARELILLFEHRRRFNVLVAVFAEHRPAISLDELAPDEEKDDDFPDTNVKVSPSPSTPKQDISNTMIATNSLAAIVRLMSRDDMKTAFVTFQTDFEAASDSIMRMNDYKLVHDLFQELENRYYLIYNDQKRLPDDDLAWENIAFNEPELRSKIDDLLKVAGQATFSSEETRWTQQLENVQTRILAGVDQYDIDQLKSGTRLLYRVLNRHPSRINAQLVATATALRLDALEDAMTTIANNLAEADVIRDNLVEEVQSGVNALSGLDDRLRALIREHNSWQDIDDELRRVKASMSQGIEELQDAWLDLEPMLKDEIEEHPDEEWPKSLAKLIDELGQSLDEEVIVTVRRQFLRLQSQVGRRFRQVDLELLTLCQELQRVGEQLDLLLRQFGK